MLGNFRSYFGLPQWEVAGLLRVTMATYAHMEAERRSWPSAVVPRLLLLLPLAPAPPGTPGYAPPPPPPPLGPLTADTPDLRKLRYRLKYCRYHAYRKRREADALAEHAQFHVRRAAATEALRALAAAPDAPPFATDVLARFAAIPASAALDEPTALAQWHGLMAAIVGLEAEAAALEAVLPPA